MKVCMFHLMPYRDLPADFEQRYNSAYIDPLWFDVADCRQGRRVLQRTLDEMVHAAKSGMHGVCTNQHHQNVYGFMANPSLMGAVLAKLTSGQDVAIIQLGSTLPSTSPPTRIAEEYAMHRLHQRRPARRGFPDRAADRRHDLQRRRADRPARALPRGAGAGREGVVGEGAFRLERQALSAPAWSISGRARSSSRIRRSGSPAPASPPPPSMSSSATTASAI